MTSGVVVEIPDTNTADALSQFLGITDDWSQKITRAWSGIVCARFLGIGTVWAADVVPRGAVVLSFIGNHRDSGQLRAHGAMFTTARAVFPDGVCLSRSVSVALRS
jgi:hypothetical protein